METIRLDLLSPENQGPILLITCESVLLVGVAVILLWLILLSNCYFRVLSYVIRVCL